MQQKIMEVLILLLIVKMIYTGQQNSRHFCHRSCFPLTVVSPPKSPLAEEGSLSRTSSVELLNPENFSEKPEAVDTEFVENYMSSLPIPQPGDVQEFDRVFKIRELCFRLSRSHN